MGVFLHSPVSEFACPPHRRCRVWIRTWTVSQEIRLLWTLIDLEMGNNCPPVYRTGRRGHLSGGGSRHRGGSSKQPDVDLYRQHRKANVELMGMRDQMGKRILDPGERRSEGKSGVGEGVAKRGPYLGHGGLNESYIVQ